MAPYFIHPEAWTRADEFKYVVDDQFDFTILDRHESEYRHGRTARLSLSPEFGQLQKNLDRIFGWISVHPHWRISLQTHKWMGVK